MQQLSDYLLEPRNREVIVHDGQRLIEAQVKAKSGIKGMAIKGAFNLINTAIPGLVGRAINKLLPDFAEALQPFYGEFLKSNETTFQRYLEKQRSKVIPAVLAVTDRRIKDAYSELTKKTYSRFRPTAEQELSDAYPQLAALLASRVPNTKAAA